MSISKITQCCLTEKDNGTFIWQNFAPFILKSGEKLNQWQLVYEVYGRLNGDKSNAILIHHALSSDTHVAIHEKSPERGWWEAAVGPGKAVNTEKYFAICINNLGSCFC